VVGSGALGFIGSAFGDLHQYLTEELPVDPWLRRPAALGVYLTALMALALFAWGAWRSWFARDEDADA
jgi:hypothetical protein